MANFSLRGGFRYTKTKSVTHRHRKKVKGKKRKDGKHRRLSRRRLSRRRLSRRRLSRRKSSRRKSSRRRSSHRRSSRRRSSRRRSSRRRSLRGGSMVGPGGDNPIKIIKDLFGGGRHDKWPRPVRDAVSPSEEEHSENLKEALQLGSQTGVTAEEFKRMSPLELKEWLLGYAHGQSF